MDARLSSIWPVFAEEARENLHALSEGILALEKDPAQRSGDPLRSVKRVAHTLKGSAGSLGLSDVEVLAHALEDVLAKVPPDAVLPSPAVEALLRCIGGIEEMLDEVDAGGEPKVPDAASLLAALRVLQEDAPVQGESLFDELWPAFRRDLEEQVLQGRQVLRADRLKAIPQLASLARELRSSAAVLNLGSLEACAAALEAQLASAKSDRPNELDQALAAIETALDELGKELLPRPPSPRAEGLGQMVRAIMGIEGCMPLLFAPDVGERTRGSVEAARCAKRLILLAQGTRADAILPMAARLQAIFETTSAPGPDSGRTIAAAADLVLSLRQLVSRGASAPAPVPAPEPEVEGVPAPAPEGAQETAAVSMGERTVRIPVGKLESLSWQIEHWALAELRQERRASELRALAAASWETLGMHQRITSALRGGKLDLALEELNASSERVRNLHRDLSRLAQDWHGEAEALRISSSVARDELRDLRTVPASLVLEPMRRSVREVAGRLNKRVELTIVGGAVRLDRRILEALKDPLMHLTRNAADHGLERPEERRAAGKPEVGQLELKVEQRGRRVLLTVSDDGKGLSIDRIRATAVARGLLRQEEADQLDDAEAMRLVFRPGFSTASEVTAISGRGIGLDVVHATASRLQGAVNIHSEPGKGTRFELDLPLTLASTLGFVVRAGRELLAFPAESVERIVMVGPRELGTVAGHATALVDGRQLPYATLAQAMGLPVANDPSVTRPALVLSILGKRAVIGIDEVQSEQEIVIQDLGRALASARQVAGATVLNDGRVVSVPNVSELLREAWPMAGPSDVGPRRRRVLVADDAITTRSLMRSVLELAGYEVITAPDGQAAFETLLETPCALVVSDVQMPRLDGLGLTRKIRAHARLRDTPVILVTSLDAEEDFAAARAAGASGYVVKREMERGKLLELAQQLLPGVE